MASYVVMERERSSGEDDAEGILLIRDGFSLIAFFLPAFWLLWHRLWIEAAFAFAVSVGLAALANVPGFGVAAAALSLLVSLYAGLECAALRIAALQRRGWRELGVIEADSRDDADIRYVVETGANQNTSFGPVATALVEARRRKAPADPALGLLLNPGRA
jgi:Protein of unknown function (DUF2628)